MNILSIIIIIIFTFIISFMLGGLCFYSYTTREYRRALKRINKKIINNDKRYIINDTR